MYGNMLEGGTLCRQSQAPQSSSSLHLTLSFHIIYHRAGRLHRHITGPRTSSCVVNSPEREPGRDGEKKRSSGLPRPHGNTGSIKQGDHGQGAGTATGTVAQGTHM